VVCEFDCGANALSFGWQQAEVGIFQGYQEFQGALSMTDVGENQV
jgi:hypothetical protein